MPNVNKLLIRFGGLFAGYRAINGNIISGDFQHGELRCVWPETKGRAPAPIM
jgi:hypothetical protein